MRNIGWLTQDADEKGKADGNGRKYREYENEFPLFSDMDERGLLFRCRTMFMHFDAFLKSFEHLGDSFYVWIVKWSMLYEIDIVESKNPFFYIQKVPPVMISRTKVKVANETI